MRVDLDRGDGASLTAQAYSSIRTSAARASRVASGKLTHYPSSLQALKKARSRRHWTWVIRPNMAARALGRGSAPGRPGAARLGFEADTGLGVRRGLRQSLPDFRRVAQRSWKPWPCPGSFLDR